VISLVILGTVLTYAFYQSLDARGLFFMGFILLVAEAFMQMKWRTSMICRNCGFDPVVYVRDPEQAGLKIKAFLEKRSDSADYLLRPPVVLPINKVKKGENLSLKL
jgi:hypothetical protein